MIDKDDVKQFLPTEKLGDTDDILEQKLKVSARNIVVSKLSPYFDTTTWDQSNAPALVKTVVAMKYASMWYGKYYSDYDGEYPAWSQKLEDDAGKLIEGMIDGHVKLEEQSPAKKTTGAIKDARDPLFEMGDRW